ncbi:MAG: hypothetical protein QM778_31520 [Myxococcales bacterium]
MKSNRTSFRARTRAHQPQLITCVVALGLVGSASACAKSGSKAASDSTKRAAQTSGELVYKDSVTATVESVDKDNRLVTLRDPEGEPFTVAVGEGVALERMEPDDKVNVAYQESLAFELQEPGAEPKMGAETTAEKLPEGVQYGRKVTTTVEILAVAPKGTAATFRNQEGDVRTVEVDNPANREKVSHLRPGDNVEVTYTEKLAVQLEK